MVGRTGGRVPRVPRVGYAPDVTEILTVKLLKRPGAEWLSGIDG